jgi:hypothetical protein
VGNLDDLIWREAWSVTALTKEALGLAKPWNNLESYFDLLTEVTSRRKRIYFLFPLTY